MTKVNKTNAMRLLDKAKIDYEVLTYDINESEFDGEKVSDILGLDKSTCFKTLSLKCDKDLYILCIPVCSTLDLKKSANNIGVKHLEMIHVKDLLKEVGYKRGSTSPIGILKKHKLYFDISILEHEKIEVSGGAMGISLMLKTKDLLEFTKAEVKDLCREKE